MSLLRRTAWIIPQGIATTSARMVDSPTSQMVLGSRLASNEATLWLSFQEKPRLPCSRWPSHRKYCWYQGRLKP